MTHLELGQISSKTVEDNGEEKEYYVDQHELPRYFIDSDIKWKHILLLKNIVKADEDFAINQTLCRAMAGPRLLSVLGYGSTKWNLQLFGQKVFAEYRSKGEKKKKRILSPCIDLSACETVFFIGLLIWLVSCYVVGLWYWYRTLDVMVKRRGYDFILDSGSANSTTSHISNVTIVAKPGQDPVESFSAIFVQVLAALNIFFFIGIPLFLTAYRFVVPFKSVIQRQEIGKSVVWESQKPLKLGGRIYGPVTKWTAKKAIQWHIKYLVIFFVLLLITTVIQCASGIYVIFDDINENVEGDVWQGILKFIATKSAIDFLCFHVVILFIYVYTTIGPIENPTIDSLRPHPKDLCTGFLTHCKNERRPKCFNCPKEDLEFITQLPALPNNVVTCTICDQTIPCSRNKLLHSDTKKSGANTSQILAQEQNKRTTHKVSNWVPQEEKSRDVEDKYQTNLEKKKQEKNVDNIINSNWSAKDKYAALIALQLMPESISSEPKVKKFLDMGNNVNLNDFEIRDVRGDGNCIYRSVLQASMEKGIEPGKSIGDNPRVLREILFNSLNNHQALHEKHGNILHQIQNGSCAKIQNLPGDILKELSNRIKIGMYSESVDQTGWGGDLELQLINCLFNLRITVVNQATSKISNFQTIVSNGITLLWVNQNHYKWLEKKHSNLVPIDTFPSDNNIVDKQCQNQTTQKAIEKTSNVAKSNLQNPENFCNGEGAHLCLECGGTIVCYKCWDKWNVAMDKPSVEETNVVEVMSDNISNSDITTTTINSLAAENKKNNLYDEISTLIKAWNNDICIANALPFQNPNEPKIKTNAKLRLQFLEMCIRPCMVREITTYAYCCHKKSKVTSDESIHISNIKRNMRSNVEIENTHSSVKQPKFKITAGIENRAVTARFLLWFTYESNLGVDECDKTKHVVEYVIKPSTKEEKCRFCESCVIPDEIKKNEIGSTTHFVSHAWGTTLEYAKKDDQVIYNSQKATIIKVEEQNNVRNAPDTKDDKISPKQKLQLDRLKIDRRIWTKQALQRDKLRTLKIQTSTEQKWLDDDPYSNELLQPKPGGKWKTLVNALVEFTKEYLKDKPDGTAPPFFWIDIFAVNQHWGTTEQKEDQPNWSGRSVNKGFERVIKSLPPMGEMIVLLDPKFHSGDNNPYSGPEQIGRAWCVFEWLKCVEIGKRLRFIQVNDASKGGGITSLYKTLKDVKEYFLSFLFDLEFNRQKNFIKDELSMARFQHFVHLMEKFIDIRLMHAFDSNDKNQILKVAKRQGVDKFNHLVFDIIMEGYANDNVGKCLEIIKSLPLHKKIVYLKYCRNCFEIVSATAYCISFIILGIIWEAGWAILIGICAGPILLWIANIIVDLQTHNTEQVENVQYFPSLRNILNFNVNNFDKSAVPSQKLRMLQQSIQYRLATILNIFVFLICLLTSSAFGYGYEEDKIDLLFSLTINPFYYGLIMLFFLLFHRYIRNRFTHANIEIILYMQVLYHKYLALCHVKKQINVSVNELIIALEYCEAACFPTILKVHLCNILCYFTLQQQNPSKDALFDRLESLVQCLRRERFDDGVNAFNNICFNIVDIEVGGVCGLKPYDKSDLGYIVNIFPKVVETHFVLACSYAVLDNNAKNIMKGHIGIYAVFMMMHLEISLEHEWTQPTVLANCFMMRKLLEILTTCPDIVKLCPKISTLAESLHNYDKPVNDANTVALLRAADIMVENNLFGEVYKQCVTKRAIDSDAIGRILSCFTEMVNISPEICKDFLFLLSKSGTTFVQKGELGMFMKYSIFFNDKNVANTFKNKQSLENIISMTLSNLNFKIRDFAINLETGNEKKTFLSDKKNVNKATKKGINVNLPKLGKRNTDKGQTIMEKSNLILDPVNSLPATISKAHTKTSEKNARIIKEFWDDAMKNAAAEVQIAHRNWTIYYRFALIIGIGFIIMIMVVGLISFFSPNNNNIVSGENNIYNTSNRTYSTQPSHSDENNNSFLVFMLVFILVYFVVCPIIVLIRYNFFPYKIVRHWTDKDDETDEKLTGNRKLFIRAFLSFLLSMPLLLLLLLYPSLQSFSPFLVAFLMVNCVLFSMRNSSRNCSKEDALIIIRSPHPYKQLNNKITELREQLVTDMDFTPNEIITKENECKALEEELNQWNYDENNLSDVDALFRLSVRNKMCHRHAAYIATIQYKESCLRPYIEYVYQEECDMTEVNLRALKGNEVLKELDGISDTKEQHKAYLTDRPIATSRTNFSLLCIFFFLSIDNILKRQTRIIVSLFFFYNFLMWVSQ